jgi:hypothetical protein
MAPRAPSRFLNRLAPALLATALLLALLTAGSYLWTAGHFRLEQRWVNVPASGMSELHSQRRGWAMTHGKVMWVVDDFISAVVPQRTASDNPATASSEWMLMSTPEERDRAWDSRRFYTQWNEWRLGSLGWYTTTGGASTSRVLSLPLWLPTVLLALPGFWLRRRNRALARRLQSGACMACGYAGIGVTTGARCPECGAVRAS